MNLTQATTVNEIDLFYRYSNQLIQLDNTEFLKGMPTNDPELMLKINQSRQQLKRYYKNNPDSVLRRYFVFQPVDSSPVDIDLLTLTAFLTGRLYFQDCDTTENTRVARIAFKVSGGRVGIYHFLKLVREMLIARVLVLRKNQLNQKKLVGISCFFIKDLNGYEPVNEASIHKERRVRRAIKRRRENGG